MTEIGWGDWYWPIFWGAAGALIAECIRYVYNRETIPGHINHLMYIFFATVCGGLIGLLIEPANKLAAFGLGVGWLTFLAKMIKIDPFNRVVDVMKMLSKGDFVRLDQSLEDVKKVLDKTKSNLVPVVDMQGKLIGIITDGQYERAVNAGCDPKTSVEAFVNRMPISVTEKAKPSEAERILTSRGIKTLVVKNMDEKPLGLVDLQHLIELKERKRALL